MKNISKEIGLDFWSSTTESWWHKGALKDSEWHMLLDIRNTLKTNFSVILRRPYEKTNRQV